MNALDRKIMNAAKSSKGAWFLGAAGAAALLTGCATPVASVKVDPNSPIAPEVAKLASADKDYPTFNEIPTKPADLQPPRVYGDRARAVVAARDRLNAATAPNTWTLNATQSFQARAQTDAGPAFTPPASSDTEAFANAVRKRATPPPPANH
jgi:hypothetical protein